jgi:iron(III) transport system substrate-binding protein
MKTANAARWKGWVPAVAVALAGALGLAACSSGSSSAGTTTITVYSGQHPETTAALASAFERQTGIQVKVRRGDEDVLANQIVQEGSASPADVYYAENSPALQFLQGKGLFVPVTASTLAQVPSRYNSPSGDWVGVSARVSGFAYNTRLLQPSQLPRSALDLAGPEWRGKIGIAPSETDLQPVVTSVALAKGDRATVAWLEALKANAGSHSYPDNESLVAAVNSGQVAIGIIDHYYWHRLQYDNPPSQVHSAFAYFGAGDPGYVLSTSGAAVLKSSTNQAAAQRFLAFLVSKPGEEIIAHSQSYEYPLGSGVTTAKNLTPFDQLQPAPLSITDLGNGQRAISLLQQAQLL